MTGGGGGRAVWKVRGLTLLMESEPCGGTVTVSFSKYLPWQAMQFLQRSTHFSKTCCRPLITSKFLASELPFHGWKGPEIAWGEIWIEFCVRLGKSGSVPIRTSAIQSRSRPMRFLGFSNHEKGALRQEISKWSTVCRTFSRSGWSVVRSASLAKGGTLKKRPSSQLHKVSNRSCKMNPWTFQKALVQSNTPSLRVALTQRQLYLATPALGSTRHHIQLVSKFVFRRLSCRGVKLTTHSI
jgi:hypothetical protein